MEKIHHATTPQNLAPNKQTPHISTDKLTGVKSWITNKQSFRDYLDQKYGLTPGKGGTKKLSNLIKSLPANRLASILSGLFSADGFVKNPSHKINCPVIQLSSVSLELLNDVRDCLICFGIHSTIDYSYLSSRGRYQGNLNISDWAVDRFMDVISFDLCPDKVQKYHQTKRARKIDKQRYRRTSEVISIEYIGQAHVYDLNIPKAHHFIAEGIVVHNCNLASINLAQTETEDIEAISQMAVRILDNTIELTSPPFAASATHNAKYRTIGVGCMGLADWLAKRHLTYTHLQEISDLFEDIGYYCTAASMELAQERGAYPAFAGSEWSKGHLIGAKPVEWFLQHASQPERFAKLSQDIKQHGIRNSHITAIAPNTSSSLVQGCTASVLPVYSKFFYEQWAKGTVPIAPPYLRDNLWFYVENKTLNQKKVVQAIATIQQWIDTGISMELLFNLNAGVYFPDEPERCLTAVDIFETLMLAWELGCKAIYYIRTVQKDSFKESNEQCIACAS